MDIINAWFAPWYNINPNLQKATEMNLFKKLGLSLVLFAPIHFRKAARIISSQTQLKSNCSAIAEIRFMNSPIRMREAYISPASTVMSAALTTHDADATAAATSAVAFAKDFRMLFASMTDLFFSFLAITVRTRSRTR